VKAGQDSALVQAVLADWRTAPVDARLRAVLGFLEKLTLTPGEVTAADVDVLRAAGASDRAVEEAIDVAFGFNLIDRLADVFDFALPTARELKWSQRILLRLGYGAGSVPG
jgi:alkylhydroperoxidase family enzyme